MAPFGNMDRRSLSANAHRSPKSGLFFLLHALADDIANIGVAFLFFLDEGGVVHGVVRRNLFLFARSRRAFRSRSRRLLALLLGLGVVERNEFDVGRLRHDGL